MSFFSKSRTCGQHPERESETPVYERRRQESHLSSERINSHILYKSRAFKLSLMVRFHMQSISPFFIPFKIGLNTVLWCCLRVTLKRSKMLLTKTVTLMVCVNEPLKLMQTD